MSKAQITPAEIVKVASLANLTLSDQEIELYTSQFQQTIAIVDQLNELDTSGLTLTAQVNGLTNITRPDVVDTERMFTQVEALSGAKNVHKGYFVVKQILDKND